jgi:predicted AAA+ superfamily ATPase
VLPRLAPLAAEPSISFFLWGPRQTGKTALLRSRYPAAIWIDLLKTDLFIRYTTQPSLLREELLAEAGPRVVVLDEVQKVPALLDEVHWLIENTGHVFALCGSSARKVRRGSANLLGGRAVRHELFGLVSGEVGTAFDPVRAVNHGYLPRHYLSDRPASLIRSYVDDYLKEEIAAEGLVRHLPSFAGFLRAAAISDTAMINYTAIARECGVSSPAVKEYFQILVDTLLGRYLPAYTKRPKRRVILSPKFYFADVGIVNHLTKRGRLAPGGELFGKAFENWVFHELSAHRAYSEQYYDLGYWRLPSGIEVDFVIDDMACAIEAKATSRVTSDHLRGLREVIVDHRKVKRRILVCLEERMRRTEDGIDILPAREFTRRLWSGRLTA